MKPLVFTGADFCFGGETAIIPVFTGASAGRSFTASKRSQTAGDFPEVGVTLNPEPMVASNAGRASGFRPAFSTVTGGKLLWTTFLFFAASAGKAPTAHAAAAKILCCNNFLLETDIPLLHLGRPWNLGTGEPWNRASSTLLIFLSLSGG